MEMKRCSAFGKEKLYNAFNKDKQNPDGLNYTCKECFKIISDKYRKSKNGVICTIYHHQKNHAIERNCYYPEYSKSEFTEWVLSNEQFHEIYNNWVKSGYKSKLKPSIDRLNDYEGYNFNNIQIVTWGYNEKKGSDNIKNGLNNKKSKAVAQYDKQDNFIKEYYSQAQASRETGVSQSKISMVCTQQRKTASGFKWTYK